MTEWLSLLEASYLAILLPAWVPSVSKRYSHATKLVMLDSGVTSSLLGFISADDLSRYPFNGFIFESWAISEIIKSNLNLGLNYEFFYIKDYKNKEIDLVAKRNDEFIGIEIKSSKTFSESLLENFHTLEKSGIKFSKKILIWGGDESFECQGIKILPWHKAVGILK